MADEDLQQDIARSSYADMLTDDERNRGYYAAIKVCVEFMVKSKEMNPYGNRYYHCCDIGTGSGLLSMMVAKSFRRLDYKHFHIRSYEAFPPMAECARKVIEANGLSDDITIHSSYSQRSTHDSPFDLLVAELLDTELIGEDCLDTYRHAISKLCSPYCLFVPHKARIYIEPIASNQLFHRNCFDDSLIDLGDGKTVDFKFSEDVKNCPGKHEIDDMQASRLREGKDFDRFSEPNVVFEFTFNDPESLSLEDYSEVEFPILSEITQLPVIAMWWDLEMFDKKRVNSSTLTDDLDKSLDLVSCAPTWARNKQLLERDEKILNAYGREAWREHWIQGIYYLASAKDARELVGVEGGKFFRIFAYRDSYSFWFDIKPCKSNRPPTCDCDGHRHQSRHAIAFLNDPNYLGKLFKSLLYNEEGDKFQAEIEFFKRKQNCIAVLPNWRINVKNLTTSKYLQLQDFSLSAVFPWASLISVRYAKNQPLDPIESLTIKFTQVQFKNLSRTHMDIGFCEGFDLTKLDEMIDRSAALVDSEMNSYFLWEYECMRIDSQDHEIITFHKDDTEREDQDIVKRFRLPSPSIIKRQELGRGWALVFWAEMKLQHTGEILSTGPIKSSKVGQKVEWYRHCHQPVYFMHKLAAKPELDMSKIDVEIKISYCVKKCLTVKASVDEGSDLKAVEGLSKVSGEPATDDQ